MAVIEYMRVRCTKQEDYTGGDDLSFYLNDIHVGNIDGVTSGYDKNHEKSAFLGDLWVDEGTVFKVEEWDLEGNDVLVEYRITSSDISSGEVVVADQITSADYEFTLHIVDI